MKPNKHAKSFLSHKTHRVTLICSLSSMPDIGLHCNTTNMELVRHTVWCACLCKTLNIIDLMHKYNSNSKYFADKYMFNFTIQLSYTTDI